MCDLRPILFVCVFALVIVACGGGSGDGDADDDPGAVPPPAPPAPVTLVSDWRMDCSFAVQPRIASYSGLIRVGDDQLRSQLVGYLMFPLAALPAEPTIVSATLTVYQEGTSWAPYTDLGPVLVDQVDVGTGVEHGVVDYPVVHSGFGVLSTEASVGIKSLDVTPLLREAVTAGRSRLDLRLRIESPTDDDSFPDQARFNSGEDEASVAQPPMIQVVLGP